jgi:hypothetical protein
MKDNVNLKQKVFESTFSAEDTYKYRLSIKVSLNGFSFLGLNDRQFVFFEDYSFSGIRDSQHLCFALDFILDTQHLLGKKYKQIDIIYDTDRNTQIPQLFFDENRKEAVAKLSYSFSSNELIYSDSIQMGYVNLFPIPKDLVEFVSINFPAAKIKSKASVLMDCLMVDSTHSQQEKMVYLNVDTYSINILVFEKDALLFYNSFAYKTPKDIVYFLLYIYDQLKLNSSTIPLTLLGKIRKGDDLYQLLYAYIKEIHWKKRELSFQYGSLFEKNAKAEFYELINHSVCE